MRRNYSGCAICDSTWGGVVAEVEREEIFFCCAVCETQFRGLVDRVKSETGWPRIDAVEVAGDRRGRSCSATYDGERLSFFIVFGVDGEVRSFERR